MLFGLAAWLPAWSADAPTRPTVALVLSGGGARGFAHIGVLQVLEELRVPVDLVVGTSMGSVVGGAYAAGSSLGQLEQLVRETDWDSVVADRPPRDALNFRRREEDLLLPSRIETGVGSTGLSMPPAAAGNAALEFALARALPAGARERPVNQLPLPFRAVAADLLTGKMVELADTPLFLTMRASLAVPGVFAPVRLRQQLLVDGGLVRNLPVDVARAMGADIIIAVNVGTPLAPEAELGSAVGVAQQMLRIFTEQNVKRSLQELGPRDVLLVPALENVGFLSFGLHEQAMQAGRRSALASAPALRALALTEADYARHLAARLAPPQPPQPDRPLAVLDIATDGGIAPAALRRQSGLETGRPVSAAQLEAATARLYGRGDLARVDARMEDRDDGRHVQISATEAPWSRSRLRIGLEFESDFSDNNRYALKLMHVRSGMNAWDAELRASARVGTLRALGLQWHQPLGAGAPWYVAPELSYESGVQDVFEQGRRAYRLGYRSLTSTLTLGRSLAQWGDIQVGAARISGALNLALPEDPGNPGQHVDVNSVFVRLRRDTLNAVGFPIRGQLLDIKLERARISAGQSDSVHEKQISMMQAYQRGDWAGHAYAEWADGRNGAAPVNLGGFLRLSGTPPASIDGNSILLARLVLARQIGAMPAALGGAVRGGFSVETGSAYNRLQSSRPGNFKQAGSVFLAIDTRFGPFYLGAGATRGAAGTLYLFLGPTW